MRRGGEGSKKERGGKGEGSGMGKGVGWERGRETLPANLYPALEL